MNAVDVITLIAILVNCVFGILVWIRAPKLAAHIAFALGMLALATEGALTLAVYRSGLQWNNPWWFLSHGLVVAPWLAFSLTYGRGEPRRNLQQNLLLVTGMVVAPITLVALFPEMLDLRRVLLAGRPQPLVRLATAGIVLEIIGAVGAIFVLTNLERTFRDSVGVMRWRIKHMVLGVGALIAFRGFAAIQSVLYSALDTKLISAAAVVNILACCIMLLSLKREKVFSVDVYPSNALLFRSFTVLAASIYFLIVGLLAKALEALGNTGAFPLQEVVIVLAIIGLAIGFLSERIRRRFRLFVSRHLRRPTYDYRQLWTTFTQQTGSDLDEPRYCQSVVTWLAGIFRALTANLWVLEETGDRFRLGGSTSVPSTNALTNASGEWQPMIAALAARSAPFDLGRSTEPWAASLREACPVHFSGTNEQICLPLTSRGQLVAILLLSDRVGGESFETEEMDLLRCVRDQVAAGLQNLRLSKELLRVKEFEAFQTMSAFFVHDLKNTASSLSLTLQNLREHFGNPAFRDDALRAVGKSVQHLEGLIGRLGLLRHELHIHPSSVDLSELVEKTVKSAGDLPGVEIRWSLTRPCWAWVDSEQFSKVILNLFLNARDAVGASGQIEIGTSTNTGGTALTVRDSGCGMSPDFISKSLFRPFQTTKKRGIGIGMFQSKLIIDAHGGRVQVDSQQGAGTTFRIVLPTNTPVPA